MDDLMSGESVEVIIDWGSGLHKRKRAEIVRFQQNGNQRCAELEWKSKKYGKRLEKEYGSIFPVDELKRWEK